jgi:hypothetical protein
MNPVERMWQQLVDRLNRAGSLSLHSSQATPAEIAGDVTAKTGDSRVSRFVWGYYYPRIFGNEAGTMTDLEAEALVHSFNRPIRSDRTAPPSSSHLIGRDEAARCRICGKRNAEGEGLS